MSLDKLINAYLYKLFPCVLSSFSKTPFQPLCRSSTIGPKKVLTCNEGSFGPGMMPQTIRLSYLKRSSLGRFKMTMYIIPRLYSELLNGWNQSMFIIRPRFLGSVKNNCPSSPLNVFQILPSYMSFSSSSESETTRFWSSNFSKPGLSRNFSIVVLILREQYSFRGYKILVPFVPVFEFNSLVLQSWSFLNGTVEEQFFDTFILSLSTKHSSNL